MLDRAETVPLVLVERSTPFGQLVVLISPEDGVVRASGFGHSRTIGASLAPDYFARGWREGTADSVSTAITRWLEGDAEALASVAAVQAGSEFTQRVWAATRAIPGGETATYGELAAAAGNPRAARAVGRACATNALAPFVPCHRVVSATGLGNYGYGVDVKAAMLALEGAPVQGARPGRQRIAGMR